MCRMLLTTGRNSDLSPYLDFVYEMAYRGNKAPHTDGFGYAVYTKNQVYVKKSIPPENAERPVIGENELFGETLIAHARKISSSSKTINNTQPLLRGMMSFAHNGTIKELGNEKSSDSSQYFKMIFKSFPEAIENVRTMSFTSLNFIMTDGSFAVAYREVREDRGYYTLFYRLENDRFTVSTEVMDGKWFEIENQTLVVYRNGHVKEYPTKGTVPHVL